MIQILSVSDEHQRKTICHKAGIEDSKDLHIIAIHNQEGIACEGAIFKYNCTQGEILWLDMGEDIDLADGLGRAILSIMEIRGIQVVTLPAEHEVLAKKLRFKKIEDHFEVQLDGYFCCSCQHK